MDFVNDLMSLRWELRASHPFPSGGQLGAAVIYRSSARGGFWGVFVIRVSAGQTGARISSLSVGQEQPHELQQFSITEYLLHF